MKVKITYFKPSGKYYTEDEVDWPEDPAHYTKFATLESLHRIKTMFAVCMENPLGFPQFSLPTMEWEKMICRCGNPNCTFEKDIISYSKVIVDSRSPLGERIELAECPHCDSLIIRPQSDVCVCGGELYPISRKVEAGTRIRNCNFEKIG